MDLTNLKVSPLYNKKILVVSRANARKDSSGLYFQNLDGYYLDRIAPYFKEMEILAPIHVKGKDKSYEIYKGYTYQFSAGNIFISEMPTDFQAGNSLFKNIFRLYKEWTILKNKIKTSDLVFIFMSTFKAVMAVKLCLKLEKPFIVYSGNDWKEDAQFQYKWNRGILRFGKRLYVKLCGYLEKWVMKNSSLKIVNSPKLYNRYKNCVGTTVEARPIIQISLKDCYFREDTCQGEIIKILSVAAIIPRKGLEYLIEGFALACKELSNIELHIVGTYADRDYKLKLDNIINQYQIASKVKWYGYVPNGPRLFKIYRKCDIFVLSSLNEGFPRVIWEAMSQGLPIIVTRLDNIYNKIKQYGELVHFISIKDSLGVKNAIIKIIKTPEYRKKLISNSREYIIDILRNTAVNQFIELITKYGLV